MSDTSQRESNGHYAKGNPGGPGRPRSAVSRSALALDEMGTEIGKEVFRMIADKALAGDLKAAEILLSRVWPMRRGRPLDIDARPIKARGLVCIIMVSGLFPVTARPGCG